jgi:hypothetical protein
MPREETIKLDIPAQNAGHDRVSEKPLKNLHFVVC